MNRRSFCRSLAALVPLSAMAQEPALDMTNNVIVLLYDGHDPAKDYKNGDIVDVQEGWLQSPATGLWRLRTPFLPMQGYYVIRIWGVTKTELDTIGLTTDYTDNGNGFPTWNWQLRTQSVPANIRNYFSAHGYVGFGTDGTLSTDDVNAVEMAYGTQNDTDFVLWWSNVRNWLYNKRTKATA